VDRDALIDAVMRGRKQVVLEKLTVAPNQPLDELLPREMRGAVHSVRSPLQALVEQKRAQARSVLAMDRLYFREVPSEMSNLLVTQSQNPPLEALTDALARAKASPTGSGGMIGSVNYASQALSPDGVVRSVPLLVNDRGHLLPQFGLALACTVLGVDPTNREEFTVAPDQVVLSPAGMEPITIPVFNEAARGRVPTIGACFAIPWFGGRDWKTMYDWPRQADVVNHVPFMLAATIGKKRADLRFNESNREKAREDIALLRKFGGLPEADPAAPFAAVLEETMKAAEFGITDLRKVPPAERQPDEVLMLKAADAVAGLRANAAQLTKELELAKAKLRRAVEGKVVIVGWAASGQMDNVPTSLHGSCPGAVVHGVVYNAIMTRNLWTRAPTWLPYAIAILFGGLMTWAVAKLTPSGSTAVAVALALAYAAFNGILVFDRWNVILGAAAPLSAIGLVWAGCTAASAGERFRINQMLHGYVDPKLVNYLNLHPENELFETKSQEVTVCFSDIQGFTTMTQQLGEKMIPLLQEYLSRMVAVIRRHGGVVNKFMGDGIMFIFGVPEREVAAIHAEQALRCCLEMQEALAKFNEERVPEGFPPLKMRCGVNTGMAYVGDAGPAEAREYTALGDTTNLAARLEPANKEFETRILVTETTFLQTLNSFVFVPVGKLQVRGRKEGTMTYELVCRTDDGDEECRQRAEAMHAMILSYQQGVFDGCLKMIAQIEARFGESRICKVYRELCVRYSEEGAPGDFHGQVRIG
jgi:class 3 adenylate cyclase